MCHLWTRFFTLACEERLGGGLLDSAKLLKAVPDGCEIGPFEWNYSGDDTRLIAWPGDPTPWSGDSFGHSR